MLYNKVTIVTWWWYFDGGMVTMKIPNGADASAEPGGGSRPHMSRCTYKSSHSPSRAKDKSECLGCVNE